jgi:hypothetical protein
MAETTNGPKTVEDARRLLREAIDTSYKGNVAALTRKLWGNKRKDFIRDFLNGRKGKLGGAAETAAVERKLRLAPGMLAVAVEEPDAAEIAEVTNELIYETLKALQAQGAAVRDDMADLKHRMTTLEFSVGNLAAIEAAHYAGHSGGLDRVDARLERIERRLELAEA